MPESAGATLGSIIAVALQNYQAALSGYARANLQAASNHRINTPGDNPSGMFTVDSLQTHMDALNTAIGNATEAGSLVSTALTAVGNMKNTLESMRSIAQEATGSLTADERAAHQAEIDDGISSLDDIVSTTKYKDTKLLDGSYTNKTIQIGADAGDTTALSITDLRTGYLGTGASPGGLADIDLSTPGSAATAVDIIDNALSAVRLEYGKLTGEKSFVIDAQVNSLTDGRNALQSSYDSIQNISDVEAAANLLAQEIRMNTAASMVAQAGSIQGNVVSLLMGGLAGSQMSSAASYMTSRWG